MNIDLSNKTALVTGAAGELGRVIVRTLAQCGADIIIHYHSQKDKAELLLKEVSELGRKSIAIQADITDFDSIRQMEKNIVDKFNTPDIVVDNAVIQYKWTSLLEQAPEDYESQFRSCVMQNVYMAKTFVPYMIKKNYGRFIGINTECSIQCFPTQSAYVAGKRGMDGIFRVLAKEIGGNGITVNQVAPGWTVSEKDRISKTPGTEEYEAGVPLKRRGTDQEVANVVAFLASDLSSFITGAYIPVCGGNVMPSI